MTRPYTSGVPLHLLRSMVLHRKQLGEPCRPQGNFFQNPFKLEIMLVHVDCPNCNEEVSVKVLLADDDDDAECVECGCTFSISVSIEVSISDIEYPSDVDDEEESNDDDDSYERSHDPNQLALDL